MPYYFWYDYLFMFAQTFIINTDNFSAKYDTISKLFVYFEIAECDKKMLYLFFYKVSINF